MPLTMANLVPSTRNFRSIEAVSSSRRFSGVPARRRRHARTAHQPAASRAAANTTGTTTPYHATSQAVGSATYNDAGGGVAGGAIGASGSDGVGDDHGDPPPLADLSVVEVDHDRAIVKELEAVHPPGRQRRDSRGESGGRRRHHHPFHSAIVASQVSGVEALSPPG
jgi:hypothetical protein